MSDYNLSLFYLLIYSTTVVILVAGMIILSYLLGGRHREPATGEPYESGILSTGSARLRFSAQFYVIAMFFVIFDLETVFLVSWAISVRETGWGGFAVILVFLAFLLSVLVYEWRIGAFDYAVSGREILKSIRKAKGI
ncbi:MAG: NADH:ubiquinone oxidoreductase subunit A [Spirochaetes bacterium RBG_16_49_21]|nr:MAG: NADH:ubiquinone oxidoreductase subunit A [Spirochaetes bacterium RBG_16_49_21]